MSPRLPPLIGPPTGFARPLGQTDTEEPIDGVQTVLDLGATGIECPIRVTGDGVPVIHRGRRVGPRLRRRAIADLRRNQLPAGISTLAELYGLVGPRFPLLLQIEDPAAFGPVLELAGTISPEAEANLWLCHHDLVQLTDWRPRTTATLLNSVRFNDLANGLERRAAELEQRGLDGLTLFHGDWSGGRVTLLHRFGLLAVASDPQYAREVAEVVDAGIDGVCSDRTEPMMAVINEYYPPPPTGGER